MSKQIRPLVAFKKQQRELYDLHYNLAKERTTSKKGIENNFYFWYGALSLKNIKGKDSLNVKGKDSFIFTEQGNFTNKCTITEIGRLLITGWYFNIEDYTKELSSYIYKAYHKKLNTTEKFNDLHYSEVVKHIRENIAYYYKNQPEVKLFIVDSLFKNTLQELLPPPDKLKAHNELIDDLKEIRANQRKKGIDYWINTAEDWEGYSYYLQDKIDSLNSIYLSFEDWKKEQNKLDIEYFKQVEDLSKEYKKSIINSSQIQLY
jgi:hypothetical protein